MCVCILERFEGTGNNLVQWQPLLLSLYLLGNWIKIIVFRIANPYNYLRQITNLPQPRTSVATEMALTVLRSEFGERSTEPQHGSVDYR